MTLVVDGTAAQRATIERLLRQICWRVNINRTNGKTTAVSGPPTAANLNVRSTGCACIQSIIASNRTVLIRPLPGPRSKIPGLGNREIRQCTGGLTVPANNHHYVDGAGNPGAEPAPPAGDGQVGCDVDLWLDVSDNGGRGYPPVRAGVPSPLWIILAHELTTGHATHFVSGTGKSRVDVSGDVVPNVPAEEAAAQASENPHRDAHGIGRR